MDDPSSVPQGSVPQGSVPEGLVFFAPDATPSYRRRRIIAGVIFAVGFLSMIWPIAALVAGPRPLVLGMPLALAWLAMWIAIVFLTLLWLYRSEPAQPSPESAAAGSAATGTPHAPPHDPR